MTALLWTVLGASLLGSLHCAGMCGAFVAFAVFDSKVPQGRRVLLHVAYHGGRLVTYTVLGVFAGVVGAGIDAGGMWAGIQRLGAILAGLIILTFGIGMILRLTGIGISNWRLPVPAITKKLLERGMRAAMQLSPTSRAISIGLLTTLLPCGWLYAFVAIAAGTGTPIRGGLTMAVFWLGTVPILVAVGTSIQKLSTVLGRALPMISAVSIVVVAALTLSGRFKLIAEGIAPKPSANVQEISHLTEEACRAADAPMPCCHDAN